MEFEKAFNAVAVGLIAVIAYFSLIGYWNVAYGQTVAGSGAVLSTYNDMQALANTTLFSLALTTSNNTNTPSGAGSTSTNTDLISRALSVLTALPTMLGLIPALFQDMAIILQVPTSYVNIVSYIFMFSFAILFGYVLIIGIRKLT